MRRSAFLAIAALVPGVIWACAFELAEIRALPELVESGAPDSPIVPGPDASTVDAVAESSTVQDAGDAEAEAAPLPRLGLDAGLVALYTFREGSGNDVHDVSGAQPPADLNVRMSDAGAAQWLDGGGLRFVASAVASSDSMARLYGAILAASEFTLEAWIHPLNDRQGTPASARIFGFTVAGGAGTNAVLLAETTKYGFRFRTSDVANAEIGDAGVAVRLQHVVAVRAPGQSHLYLDGALIANDTTAGNLSTWDQTVPLCVGNAPALDRPWLGVVRLAAVYARALTAAEVARNFVAGAP
jgi:hypothetical protein